jgi:hypothetical protein
LREFIAHIMAILSADGRRGAGLCRKAEAARPRW